MQFCSNNVSECYLVANNCPVDNPILCDGECKQFSDSCTSYDSQEEEVEANAVETNVDLDKTDRGCPIATPFRCSQVSYANCQTLPYTSYESLFEQSCTTSLATLRNIIYDYMWNDCVSAATPYTCGNGQCVATETECSTCSFFCETQDKCVASEADCTQLQTSESEDLNLQLLHMCPSGSPYRCVVDGRCVQTDLLCNTIRSESSAAIYNLTYTGPLIDVTCPFSSPIRCFNGTCAPTYSSCMLQIDRTKTAFTNPIAWGAEYDAYLTEPCQVYC